VAQPSILLRLVLKNSLSLWKHVLIDKSANQRIQYAQKNFNDYMVKWIFKKFKRLRQANASFFFKNTLEICCYCFESKKPSGDQIREMVATTGFGRFHMESPYRSYCN
jgi:hypothetical protein